MKIHFIFAVMLLLYACKNTENSDNKASYRSDKDLTQYVNPMIGTSKMGHVYPGATSPFGMVQVSPQTNMEVMFDDGKYNKKTYSYCAGYQYKDTTIIGFAHTNFSGTGHADLGDCLLMPTIGSLNLYPLKTEDGGKGYYSTFSHNTETVFPGYYKVDLESYGIRAELTASDRVGFHRYTFPQTQEAHIILDLVYNVYHHENKNVWTFVRIENDTLVTGYRQTKGWARDRKVFFAMAFSKPFLNYGHEKYDDITYNGFYRRFNEFENFPEMGGKNLRAFFDFEMQEGEQLKVKFALSSVSTAGALNNMQVEIPHWDFDRVRKENKDKWNAELSKIEVEMMDEKDMMTFYTAMYHTCLSPIVYEDVDGTYRGLDQNIHSSDGFTNYTIFSLWDTYRALHPLFNILQPKRNNDMIKSMLAHYDQSVHNMLPIWSHYANENWCMIGYHAASVIADAMVKNVGDFDRKHALEACISTAKVPYFDGLGEYMKYHYVPDDKSHSSVSKTLEYAYDDWCIAQIAKAVGEDSIQVEFYKRSQYYQNVYDKSIGFMRPKLSNGQFRKNFDPMDTHGQGFIEGNAWNYGLYVPQDIENMIVMMGGKERVKERLDSLFTMKIDDKFIEKNEDITRDGIIGSYVHGNEPGHHIPYLYNWTGYPEKAQAQVRMIVEMMYDSGVDGLCGNDDAGQMSAWYIFSALGFYPVTPGLTNYALGSPSIKKAIIHLENGKKLHISTLNQGDENVYVEKVLYNGEELKDHFISHMQIVNGGELQFVLSSTP